MIKVQQYIRSLAMDELGHVRYDGVYTKAAQLFMQQIAFD